MTMPKHGGQRDSNQAEIMKAANEIPGCTAIDLGAFGCGMPDILIGWRGQNLLAEIKRPKGKLNALQVEWHKEWTGQVRIIRSVDDLLKLLKL